MGIHGLDHVYWHDHIKKMDKSRTHETLDKAVGTFEEIMGEKPRSFAAPGWMINGHALAFFGEYGLAYSADTRGTYPFFPRIGGETFTTPQVPLTLPTLDEMVGLAGNDSETLSRYFIASLKSGLNVMAVHTEMEGKRWLPFLESFIRRPWSSASGSRGSSTSSHASTGRPCRCATASMGGCREGQGR